MKDPLAELKKSCKAFTIVFTFFTVVLLTIFYFTAGINAPGVATAVLPPLAAISCIWVIYDQQKRIYKENAEQ